MSTISAYDHYGYAFVAVFGTAFAVWIIDALMRNRRSGTWIASLRGVVPPFINIVGVLFGLTLAFLANDTWNAHDRTTNAVYREADAMRSLMAMAAQTGPEQQARLTTGLRDYATAAMAEWPHLARRATLPEAQQRSDALLSLVSARSFAETVGPTVHALVLRKVDELRADRDARISLSQAHVNPLKWLGMAFLGFVTLLSVAVVHAENRRAALTATILFALAAAPAAAIVLVQSNPFQPPAAVSFSPIQQALGG